MGKQRFNIPNSVIIEFCKKNQIKKLAFFGSVLRDDFNAQSDLDILVEFKPGKRIGLLRMAGMQNELSSLFKRSVDLRTPADLSPYFRDDVIHSAEVQYAE